MINTSSFKFLNSEKRLDTLYISITSSHRLKILSFLPIPSHYWRTFKGKLLTVYQLRSTQITWKLYRFIPTLNLGLNTLSQVFYSQRKKDLCNFRDFVFKAPRKSQKIVREKASAAVCRFLICIFISIIYPQKCYFVSKFVQSRNHRYFVSNCCDSYFTNLPLIIFAKRSILDVWQGSKYASTSSLL